MGSAQSNPTAPQKAIIERLRAFDLQEKEQAVNEEGFVEIDHVWPYSSLKEKALGALWLPPSTLDVSQLEDWQTKLLADPKNR